MTPYYLQAKAFSSIERLFVRQGEYLSVPVGADHLNSWRSFREPVILTVWDAAHNVTYWQSVQAALAAADLRSGWRNQPPSTARIWVPTANVLNESSVERLASRAVAAWQQLDREQEGAKALTKALRDDLGLEITYDVRFGTITIPEGTFTLRTEGGSRMHLFGHAARCLGTIATHYGISKDEAFEKIMKSWFDGLRALERGEKGVMRSIEGETIQVFEDIEHLSRDFFKMFEQSDDD